MATQRLLQLRKSTSRTPKGYLYGGLAMVIIAAVVTGLEFTNTTHLFHHDTKTASVSQSQYNSQRKAQTINSGGNPASDSQTNKGTPTTTYKPPTNTDNISIAASQPGSSEVTITSKLIGYSDGSCSLTVTNGAKTNTQTAQVVYAPDFSTCAGFSVPVSSLGTGTWNISLAVTSGGSTLTKTMTYMVK